MKLMDRSPVGQEAKNTKKIKITSLVKSQDLPQSSWLFLIIHSFKKTLDE